MRKKSENEKIEETPKKCSYWKTVHLHFSPLFDHDLDEKMRICQVMAHGHGLELTLIH